MNDMKMKIDHMKQVYPNMSLLYVEDNQGLRQNMGKVLKTICSDVWCAENGDDAWAIYNEQRPNVVIVDIHIPGMDGFELIRKIKTREPSTHTIVLSGHSEKEHLLQAINLGVQGYLMKPTKLQEVFGILEKTAESLHDEDNRRIMQTLLHDVFHYQNNMLLMFMGDKAILANHRFLDFFGADSLQTFLSNAQMDKLLLEHDNFLYSDDDRSWLSEALANTGKLYHTKMIDKGGEYRHLIMKSRDIPEKEGYTVISFDDVTELQLMALFDSKMHASDQRLQEKATISKLFKIVQDNTAQVEIHNFYKGLSITNPGIVVKIDGDTIMLKSSYTQLKIIQMTKNMLITSEIFPEAVWVRGITGVNFDEQTVLFSNMEFVIESACQRQNIRLEPDQKHTVTLFYRGKKVPGDVRIVDISVSSAKIELDAIPAGMGINDNAELNMVLSSRQTTIIHTKGTIYRIEEMKRSYHIVILFELQGVDYKHLTDYMAERQMALIREFKSLS